MTQIDVKNSILHSISESKPLPKWYFRLVTGVRMLIISIMVIISGFVLLGLFAAVDQQSLQYLDYVEKLSYRISIITFPILWIIIFGIFLVTVLSLIRSLKYGYRASISVLIVGFIISSFIVAISASLLFGERVIHLAHSPVVVLEDFIWAQPNHGRLTGTVINRGDNGIILYDSIGYQWVINTENLLPKSLDTIKTQDHVRIVGIRSGDFAFTACQIFPWEQSNFSTVTQSLFYDDAVYVFNYPMETDSVDIPIQEVCNAIIDR